MEQVFVVNRRDFFAGDWPQGFCPQQDGAAGLLAEFHRLGFFVPRADAESNPAWKQLIPYCVICSPGQVFCVQRKKAQTESRLHGLLSIGLGGHMNPTPDTVADPFLAALRKELDEELAMEWPGDREFAMLGLLNDDSNPVGQVHAGLVYRLELPPEVAARGAASFVKVREISKMVGGFRSLVELAPLWQDPARFESWSRVLLQAGIAGRMVKSQARSGHPRRWDHGAEESHHG